MTTLQDDLREHAAETPYEDVRDLMLCAAAVAERHERLRTAMHGVAAHFRNRAIDLRNKAREAAGRERYDRAFRLAARAEGFAQAEHSLMQALSTVAGREVIDRLERDRERSSVSEGG